MFQRAPVKVYVQIKQNLYIYNSIVLITVVIVLPFTFLPISFFIFNTINRKKKCMSKGRAALPIHVFNFIFFKVQVLQFEYQNNLIKVNMLIRLLLNRHKKTLLHATFSLSNMLFFSLHIVARSRFRGSAAIGQLRRQSPPYHQGPDEADMRWSAHCLPSLCRA